jgi:glycosyltransferase involved in cell wall biosynthesis
MKIQGSCEPFSIVIPFFNNEDSLRNALVSIKSQDQIPSEIVIVDDCSANYKCREVLDNFISEFGPNCPLRLSLHRNAKNVGLAATYNAGIACCQTELIVLMHPDVVLPSPNEISRLLEPLSDQEVVVSGHINSPNSNSYWSARKVWEKSVLAPSNSARNGGFNGQFDAIKKSVWLAVNGFDAVHFRTAGEDGDFVKRVLKFGKVVTSNAKAEHQHDSSKRDGFQLGLRKSLQYGNAAGVLARVHGSYCWLYREYLLVLCFVFIFLSLKLMLLPLSILMVSILRIPFLVYRRDRSVIVFVLLIPYEGLRLFCHMAGSVKGLIEGRQTL